MGGQQDSIGAFAEDIRSFASKTSEGINGLKRTVNTRPCVGPSEFRNTWKDVVKRADSAHHQVSALGKACSKETSVQVLLSQYVALHHEHQSRLRQLLEQLRQYGYQAEYKGPLATEPLQLLGLTEAPQASSPSPAHPEEAVPGKAPVHTPAVGPEPQEVTPSPEPLGDLMSRYGREASRIAHFPEAPADRTSQRLSTSSVSDLDMTPTMRELQRKYASGSSDAVSAKKQPCSGSSLFGRYREGFGSETPEAVGKQLAYLSLETPGGALKPSAEQGDIGKAVDHLALEHPRFSPTNRSSEDLDGQAAMSAAAQMLAATPAPGPPAGAWGGPPGDGPPTGIRTRSKQESVNARLAAGEAPWDMISLKAAIQAARPGTGEIARVIANAAFQPQAAAFTSMLSMCAKNREWQKALEVFQAMRDYHPAVRPNTVHYSSLISACATVGRCDEAMQVFLHMQNAARTDKGCLPNVITYSALITAFVAGGRLARAHEIFLSMRHSNIAPDHICYSTLIAGFERSGDMDMARQIAHQMRVDSKHMPPAGSPMHQQRLPATRPGCYPEHAHMAGPPSPPYTGFYAPDSADTSPIRGSGLTPHPAKLGHVRFNMPFADSNGAFGIPGMAETPQNGIGDFGGREQLIPAVYNTAGMAEQIGALPQEDPVTSLLAARSPALFNMANDLTAAPGMSFLDNLTGSLTATGAFTPAGTAPLQTGTPSTADLLRAAQSGSTAQLTMEAYARQNQAVCNPAASFAPSEGPFGSPPRKQQQPFSLFQGEPVASSATADPEVPLHAVPGSPQVNRLSSLQNRTFDAAPGSPLRRGASSITVGPISRQGTPHKSMLDKTHSVLQSLMESGSNDGERSSGAHDVLLGSLTCTQGSSTSVDPQTGSLNRQPSALAASSDPCPIFALSQLNTISTRSQTFAEQAVAGSFVQGSVPSHRQDFVEFAPSGVHPPSPKGSSAPGSYLWAAGRPAGPGQSSNVSSPGGSPTKASKLNVNAPVWKGSPSKAPPGSLMPAPAAASSASSTIPAVSIDEFKHMPLRLSRQMLLDHWNEAIAFVSATLDARLAGGNDDAGLVAEDLDPLQLSKDQRSALLNMLLQSKRMRLVMRDGQRTYTLPQ